MTNINAEMVRVRDLRPHPLNEEIYGDRADADLVASIKERGVLNPILVSPSLLIISGHRRWGAAWTAGVDAVPVVYFRSDDPLDIEEAIIESNRQREKTNEQKAREYKHLKKIMNERESRSGANQFAPSPAQRKLDRASASQEAEAKPTAKAAAHIGISQPTAVRMEAVVDAIDALRESGATDKAEALRQELERSAKSAYNKVRAEQKAKAISEAPPAPPPVIPTNAAIVNADSRTLAKLGIQPVHLVITSPPYNVGIDYNEHDDNLSQNEYLDLIEEVFRACYDVMADGARIAVNVPFGVGRNPWVPFAARIMDILDAAKFTLRGQIIWDKGNSGNRTSWGSFRLPSDPSLRDTSEAIIVAHKGSSKLHIPESAKRVDGKGTHTPALASSDYFMELAQDHWVVAPESARRVGHPAPFPVALAKRLIDLYAYPGAHILDPFAGSGSTGIAAMQAQCSVTLVEVDPTYCRMIEERLSHD